MIDSTGKVSGLIPRRTDQELEIMSRRDFAEDITIGGAKRIDLEDGRLANGIRRKKYFALSMANPDSANAITVAYWEHGNPDVQTMSMGPGEVYNFCPTCKIIGNGNDGSDQVMLKIQYLDRDVVNGKYGGTDPVTIR